MTLSKRSKSRTKHNKECVGSLPSCYCAEQLDNVEQSVSTPKPSKKNFGGILGSLTTLRSSRKTAAVEHQRGFIHNANDPSIPLQSLYPQNLSPGGSGMGGPLANMGIGMCDIRNNPFDNNSHHYATLSSVKHKMKSKPPISSQ